MKPPEDISRSIQSILDSGIVSKPKLWGKLLGQGYEPDEINARLLSLEATARTRGRVASRSKAAIARQEMLLGGIANRRKDHAAPGPVKERRGFDLQQKIRRASVVVIADDPKLNFDLARTLKSIGISNLHAIDFSGDAERSTYETICDRLRDDEAIAVCAVAGSQWEAAEIVNRAAVQMKRPAIYYRTHGLHMQVGPLVIPGKTACVECLRIRRDSNLAPWERRFNRAIKDVGALGAALGLDWLAVELVKVFTDIGEPVSRGRVMFIDYLSGLPELHPLLRVPRCPVCGPARKPQVRLWEEL